MGIGPRNAGREGEMPGGVLAAAIARVEECRGRGPSAHGPDPGGSSAHGLDPGGSGPETAGRRVHRSMIAR
jgi:hypothetical protein